MQKARTCVQRVKIVFEREVCLRNTQASRECFLAAVHRRTSNRVEAMILRSLMFASVAVIIFWKWFSIRGACVQKNSSKCLKATTKEQRLFQPARKILLVSGCVILGKVNDKCDADASSMPTASLERRARALALSLSLSRLVLLTCLGLCFMVRFASLSQRR